MIEKCYDLNGQAIVFQAESETLLSAACAAWQLPEAERRGVPFRLIVAEGQVRPPQGQSQLLFDGMMPDKLHCTITEIDGEEYLVAQDRVSLLLGQDEGLLTIAPGEERLLRSSIAFQAINAALTLGGQYFVHGAALVLPRDDRAILILGASGFGKTTTTLSLLPAGFRLLTDDASVIKQEADGDRVWGMGFPLKVHRKSAAMLPWLAPLLTDKWNSEDEQPVTPAALASLAHIVAKPQETYPIAAIISLGKRSGDGHRVRPLAKADMLVAVAADNVARNLKGVSGHHQARMKHLAALVSATPTYELNAGPNLETLPGALLAALDYGQSKASPGLRRGYAA